ncbi:MAG: hypothetical protein ACP5QO_10915 [Clostridia bacterium]
MLQEHRCPVCNTEMVVPVGPLTLIDDRMELREVSGLQCTLCGHLGIQIPQPWLVRLYPPDVSQITVARRERRRLRQGSRIRHHRRVHSQS